MTILPHTISKFFHYQVSAIKRSPGLIDSAACKAMQVHAEEIEVARRFWACPFQTLYIGRETAVERQFLSTDANAEGVQRQ